MSMALVMEAVQFLLSEIHTIDPGKVAKAANLISDLELAKKSVGFAAPAWDWLHKLGSNNKLPGDQVASGGVVPLTTGAGVAPLTVGAGVAPLLVGRTGIVLPVTSTNILVTPKVDLVPVVTGVVSTPADVTSVVFTAAEGIADPTAAPPAETK